MQKIFLKKLPKKVSAREYAMSSTTLTIDEKNNYYTDYQFYDTYGKKLRSFFI